MFRSPIMVLFLFPLIFAAAPGAGAQDCFNYDDGLPQVVARVPIFGGDPDCLAYDGDRLAAACGSCLNWMIIGEDGIPALADTFGAAANIKAVDVQGDLAFLALKLSGLQIVDFSTPGAPVLRASVATLQSSTDVRASGDHLYLADNNGGLRIFDISDPAAPSQVFSSGNSGVSRVAVAGGYCWEFQWMGILTGYDVADPASPIQVFREDLTHLYSIFDRVEASGDLLRYSRTFCDPDPAYPAITQFRCRDVSDPAAPVDVDFHWSPGDWVYQTGDQSAAYLTQPNEILILGFGATSGENLVMRTPGIAAPLAVREGLLYGGIEGSLAVIDKDRYAGSPQLSSFPVRLYEGLVLDWDLEGDHLFFQAFLYDPERLIPGFNDPECVYSRAYVLDVSDPSNLVPACLGPAWAGAPIADPGLMAYGDYLYTEVGVWDWLSNQQIGSFVCHGLDVLIGDAIYQPTSNGIVIFDLADPTAPVQSGILFPGQDQRGEPIVVEGGVAFTRTIEKNRLKLASIDVADPLHPVPLAYLANCGRPLDIGGPFLYLDDGTDIQLVDTSDPAQPALAGSMPRPLNFRGLAARGTMFYLGWDTERLQVGDSAEPAALTLSTPYDLGNPIKGIKVHDGSFFVLNDEGIISWALDCSDPGPDPLAEVGGLPQRPLPGGASMHLAQPHPNPFNPSTSISWELYRAGPVDLAIYDLAGRRLRTLVRAEREAGPHAVVWDGKDGSGIGLPSGLYFVGLRCGAEIETRKISLIK